MMPVLSIITALNFKEINMKLARKLTLIMLIAVIAVMISYFAKANDRYVTIDLVFND